MCDLLDVVEMNKKMFQGRYLAQNSLEVGPVFGGRHPKIQLFKKSLFELGHTFSELKINKYVYRGDEALKFGI